MQKIRTAMMIAALAVWTLPCVAVSTLGFSSVAKPVTLKLNGENRLGNSGSSGFYLRRQKGDGHVDTLLGHAVQSENRLCVSASGGRPCFTFRIDEYEKHLSIHLVDVEGVADDEIESLCLYLQLAGNGKIGTKTLDDVIKVSGTQTIRIQWNYLWGSTYEGKRGGVALYDGELDGERLDECLASIWANEALPRPAGHPLWTEKEVLGWVARYRSGISGLSEVILEASSPLELYDLTQDLVLANDVKRVYLHCKTWRGEYWPKKQSRVHVNTKVFPKGMEDLKAYADYLKRHGVMLRLHSVSCGIGKNDPDYVAGTVDRRLAAWGTGTLETAVSESDRRLLFRPAADAEQPIYQSRSGPFFHNLQHRYFRVDDEIIKVAELNAEGEVWTLERCSRGEGATEAVAHAAGAEVVGLYCAYGQNYIPAYDLGRENSLMDELAREYANLVNDLQLGHLHFDGPEIHRLLPWVERDLFNRIYSYVDHPTTSSRVGKSIAAHFEQEFSGIREDLSLSYFALNIDIRTDDPQGLPATSRLDTHFHAQESLMVKGRRPFFSVPQSGRGISRKTMEAHGLFAEMNRLFRDWIELAPVFHEEDAAYVASVMKRTPKSNHYEAEDVLVLRKNGKGRYVFVPHHVMGRTSGEDAPFKIRQEKGTVPRKQSMIAGETLELNNTKAAQQLKFVIRVNHTGKLPLMNPTIAIGHRGLLTVKGTVEPGQYLYYFGGPAARLFDADWNLLKRLSVTGRSFTVAPGANQISVKDKRSKPVELETQFIVLGEPYMLKTKNPL